tara:strand:+ start:1613 stop:1984 length:372 start_codon:yes stop_codon:yes gene_type:complete
MKFSEQILENNLNIIKSYSSDHIYIQGKKYNYNVIVPPEKSIIKCNKNITNITKEFILKNLNNNVNFVILALNNTECIAKTPIISELNQSNIGIELMTISAACSSHNILVAEKRNFITFFLFD